ncbi:MULTISPECIES: SEC-C domain-containing protein [unclassified Streptomyces]|uniref:SEC-C domain-containing protein n=1 Tax=unclassified Streptomyces TaxID=2593676 RepID=UPI00278C0035|nr:MULTISPECIES: SEC-C domain-containing protein [unclassified Streptomyces]
MPPEHPKAPNRRDASATEADEMAEDLMRLARQHPQDRDELLLEAASLWEGEQRYDRAVEVYDVLRAGKCADRDVVDAYRAGALAEAGRVEEFRAAAAELRARHPHDWASWLFVAETFESLNELRTTAEWCTAGLAHLIGPGTDLTTDLVRHHPQALDQLLVTRHRARRALREPHDPWDDVADAAHERRVWSLGQDPLPLDELHDPDRSDEQERRFHEAALERLNSRHTMHTSHPANRPTVMLFWPREEFAKVLARWPELSEHYGAFHPEHADILERALRDYSDRGTPRLALAPATLDGLLAHADDTGADPTEGSTRAAYAAALAKSGDSIPWPPPRNGPCWCGSGRKYKKCHGGPAFS